MHNVSSIWQITLVGMNFRDGITREFMISALILLKKYMKDKRRRGNTAKPKVVGLEVQQIPDLTNRSDRSW